MRTDLALILTWPIVDVLIVALLERASLYDEIRRISEPRRAFGDTFSRGCAVSRWWAINDAAAVTLHALIVHIAASKHQLRHVLQFNDKHSPDRAYSRFADRRVTWTRPKIGHSKFGTRPK